MEYDEDLSPPYSGPTIPGLRIIKDPTNYDWNIKVIGVHKSSVSGELKRNRGHRGYRAQ